MKSTSLGTSTFILDLASSLCHVTWMAGLVILWLLTPSRVTAAPFNVAPDGDGILGAGIDTVGTNDVSIFQSGIIGVVNDQDIAVPGPFNIRINRSVDTYAAETTTNEFDFAGILFETPQNGINSLRVQNFTANDGGWWGTTSAPQNGVPLTAADLAPPQVQVTTNGGVTWTPVSSTSDYVTAYTGVIRGTGVPTSSAGPLATFNFTTQNGINGIRLIGNAGGMASPDDTGFIGVIEIEVLQDVGVVFPTLNINTATGAMTLNTGTGTARGIQGYSITSGAGAGALKPSSWLSISDNYDTGHPGANQVDTNDQWTELTAASSRMDLSESQFGGDGGLLNASRSIPLGNAWIRNPFGEEIQMEITLSDGRKRKVDVTYNGASENPLELGDMNFDGSINALDWPVVRNNFNADLVGLTRAEAYNLGDLNSDRANNRLDFSIFKQLYDEANGVDAFNSILATVPEPNTFVLFGIAALANLRNRRTHVAPR
jgi:hypothetical protein